MLLGKKHGNVLREICVLISIIGFHNSNAHKNAFSLSLYNFPVDTNDNEGLTLRICYVNGICPTWVLLLWFNKYTEQNLNNV